MQYPEDLTGHLLVAIPNTAHTAYNRGIMLVTSHWPAGGASCMINKPIVDPGYSVTRIMSSSGIDFKSNSPVFYGGPDEPSRIQFVHTLDWQCPSTKVLNKHIGVTQELSILSAIAADEGPEYFRCITGHRVSGPGHLDGELQGQAPWIPQHRWLVIPATVDTVFGQIGDQQWLNAISIGTKQEVANWF
jgi:putative transcriptional regulator